MRITVRRPDDFHVHLRDGDMLRAVAPYTAAHFGRGLVMPNVPAIHDAQEASAYTGRILDAVEGADFQPIVAIKLTQRTTPGLIREAANHGVRAAKLYPQGATTGSHDGVTDVDALFPVFGAMQDVGMVLCIHGERPGSFVLDREREYLPTVAHIARNFPGLKAVVEHITTEAAVKFVREASVNVACTITAHHLQVSLDEVLGSGIRPHLFCYPVPKTWYDRRALIDAAINGLGGKAFFGSDSAPHARSAKESACGCAGVFSAPVALAVLAEVFIGDEDARAAEYRRAAFERFTSVNGAAFYGLPPNEGTITLEQSPWVVPQRISRGPTIVVPWRADETLPWRVVEAGKDGIP